MHSHYLGISSRIPLQEAGCDVVLSFSDLKTRFQFSRAAAFWGGVGMVKQEEAVLSTIFLCVSSVFELLCNQM